MICTWKDCQNDAVKPLVSKDGETWANLCAEHHAKHDTDAELAIRKGGRDNMKRMMSNYIKAQGGAKAAAKRILGGQQ